MFERYTEKARRVIFFARYEASQFGSPYIETEHVLLGLLREDKALTNRFLRSSLAVEEIRKQIESATMVREKTSTSVDLPLSNECKRVLAYAAEEAEVLSEKFIGTEQLLLGLLREEKSFAAQILNERGLRISAVREALRQAPHGEGAGTWEKEIGLLADFSTFLTKLAKEGRLLPCIGREKEVDQVIHILGRSGKNNALLVGEAGVGKRTITEALVQRVAGHMGPDFLQERFFVAIDLGRVVAAQRMARIRESLRQGSTSFASWGANAIFVFDELHMLLAGGEASAQEITLLLKRLLLEGKVRCIALATPEEYHSAIKKAPWLDRCFRTVEVAPPNQDDAVKILHAIKERFEKFHSVQYTDDALKAAVVYSGRHVKNRSLPDKAIDLMDDAGAYVRMKHAGSIPQEVLEARKKLQSIVQSLENAIANHEFEKAPYHGDEERKEKAALRELEKKHNISAAYAGAVTAEHVEAVLAAWIGVPVESIRQAETEDADTKEQRGADGEKQE